MIAVPDGPEMHTIRAAGAADGAVPLRCGCGPIASPGTVPRQRTR